MIVKQLYVTDKMGVFSEPPPGKRFTRRKVYFTQEDRADWKVEIFCEIGCNLTNRKLDHIIPLAVWWIASTFDVRPSRIMWVDPRPQRKPSNRLRKQDPRQHMRELL